jgi:iron complex outermembrane recepter protein
MHIPHTHRLFLLTPVASVTFLLCTPLALAQNASPPTVTLRTVTVTANADASAEGLSAPFAGGQVARGSRVGILGTLDRMDTPFSGTSYTNQLIQDQQAKNIGSVLQNDASVRPARGFGNFQQAYFIRGFTVYSDDVAYNGLYGLVPRQYIATEFAERVDVFRGANAFLSGSGAGSVAGGGIGGLINVVPKRAPNKPLSQLSLGLQSGGQTYVAADLARRFGPDQATGIRINAARRGGGTGVDDEKQTLSALSVGLDWRNSRVRVSGDLGYQTNDLDAPRPSVTPGVGLPILDAPDAKANFAQPWTFSNSKDVFGTVRAEVDFSDHITAWGAVGLRSGKEANSVANPTLVSLQGNSSSFRFDNVRQDNVQTGEIGVRGKFKTGSVGHSVVASASSFKGKERNAYGFSDFAGFAGNIYQPFNVTPPAANISIGGLLGSPLLVNQIKTSSLALADTLSMAQDRVLLTLGARHQTIEDTSFDYNTGLQTATYDKSRITPVVGIVFKATPQLSVYANYIEGLVKGDTASGAGITNLGEVFEPYVAKQKEVGVKYDGGKIGGSAAVFSTSKPSGFVQNNTFGINGKQRNQGVELSVFGEPVKGVRLLGGLTLLDAEQVNTAGGLTDGKSVIGVPKQQFNLGGEWDVPGARGLALNAWLTHTGRQFADAANTQTLSAWTRLDVGARYLVDLGGSNLLTLRGRVDNLAGKSYWESSGGFPGAGYLVQAQPRTFVLTASVDF